MLKQKSSVIEIILSAIALIVALTIFLKAFIDIDTNYDAGWYQLPFAARIWGIVPAESFLSEDVIEYRYLGFPLLANFLQGLLWKLTGRIQAANLVGYLCLIGYFLILKSFFRVPLYLSVIAIFAIPAVLTHASSSFVDLFGNVGVSILMLSIYRFFSRSKLPDKSELFFALLGAAIAVNTKPQLQPLVFVLFWITGIRLLWLYFKYTNASNRRLWLTVPLATIASLLIFFTPVKNTALYGNPFYPIKIQVAGIVLNHELSPATYQEGDRPQKWLQSIFEIGTPTWWSADQWNGGQDEYMDRGGGFFGVYVAFNLLLLIGLAIREQLRNRQSSRSKSRNATTALLTILFVSLIPANFPQSHELRYFMFWMITLVSFNLVVISSLSQQVEKWLQVKYAGLVYLVFLAIVWTKISNFYTRPVFNSLEQYTAKVVKTELIQQMQPNQRNCLIARHAVSNPKAVPFATIQSAFFYSSHFHPEVKYEYGIKAAIDPSKCEALGLNEVPSNVPNSAKP